LGKADVNMQQPVNHHRLRTVKGNIQFRSRFWLERFTEEEVHLIKKASKIGFNTEEITKRVIPEIGFGLADKGGRGGQSESSKRAHTTPIKMRGADASGEKLKNGS